MRWRIIRKYLLLGLIAVFSLQGTSAFAAFSEEYYSGQNILFYDPRQGNTCSAQPNGSLSSPAPTALTGATNPEKVWNYMIARGLTPVGAASAMGNMEQESSTFDPWAGESGNRTVNKSALNVGFGIIQWTNTGGDSQGRRYKVMKNLEDNGVKLNATDTSQNDKALLLELNWLWDGEYGKMTWQEQVNAETTVDGKASVSFSADNTGNGGAMVFHKLVERSADGTKGKQERIDSAKKYLEQFGASGATTSSADCGVEAVSEGGLTEDQAKKFVMKYGKNQGGDSAKVTQALWGMCGGGGSNCVTFAYFFNKKFTDLSVAQNDGNGGDIAKKLISKGAKSGSQPKPFSTWSSGNHVAVILGIQGDTLIVGHADCSRGKSGIRGEGNGTYSGSGSAFITVGKKDDSKTWLGKATPKEFVYPDKVDVAAIQEYIK